jgi:hypothetical protein
MADNVGFQTYQYYVQNVAIKSLPDLLTMQAPLTVTLDGESYMEGPFLASLSYHAIGELWDDVVVVVVPYCPLVRFFQRNNACFSARTDTAR